MKNKELRALENMIINDLMEKAEYSAEDVLTENPYIIDRVIFNEPATIVFWTDGTKTVVRSQSGDTFNKVMGLALCIVKKLYGNTGWFNEIFKEFIPEYGSKIYIDANNEVMDLSTNKVLNADEEKAVKERFKVNQPERAKVDKGKLMALYRAGWQAKDIADEMGIHITTVYNYLRDLKEDSTP